MTRWFERLRSRFLAFLHDLLWVPIAWIGAYWMRFNLGAVPTEFWGAAWELLPLVMLICALVYSSFGLYRGVWRFASLPDLTRIAQAITVSSLLVVLVLFLLSRNQFLPRSVPPLFLLFQLIGLAGPRLLYRRLKDHQLGLRPGERVLVVGADRAGEMLVRDMLRDRSHQYNPVAFVDDKLRRQGGDIHGVPVRGRSEQIPALVESLGIDLIMLAVPTASDAQMQRLVELCERSGKPFRTVPQLKSVLSGAISIRQLRPVSIDDLLGRNPVQLDWDAIRAGLTDRIVLVTGAGGSIGSELCRQIIAARPKRLVLADNGELNLYRLDFELAARADTPDFGVYLVDVTDRVAMEQLFARERPQTVFHAAAYKHVPMLEGQVRAAVRNNLLGTEIVAECADRRGCERFVLISTDKAVNPANVMGATKRAAEVICQARAQRSSTRFITVRFGNVLGSAGSVVPLFRRQIEQGGPVTVTHPEIERFFMTIPEACQLIMQAALIGTGGEIFVLDMGKPVKIRYLAEQMIRLAGREPGQDIQIQYVGLRPGEKLYEELFYEREDLLLTEHAKIRAARRGLVVPDDVAAALDQSRVAVEQADTQGLVQALRALVPEWQAQPDWEQLQSEERPQSTPSIRSAAP
ncbi:polysaccharide biosynthesis protein [Halochromatium salexigens]|uniref:Polysaccharide biosynthesis protein n=1 Tax=Halochromatium salexigens TaxID=49447 RepID=A0AAJ0UDB2_HALSE|nr:nucleoside-diphosphate sugar epimerase/dehydratase [Halochromatium salexigens]MBK5929379.1 polysaccharide biosynthesis protein [Halochromatium salexigens]